MTDVLTIARERKDGLRQEIAELDEFIRIAENLMRTGTTHAEEKVQPQTEGRRERSEIVAAMTARDRADDEADGEADGEAEETPDAAEVVEADATEAESSDLAVRKFPWTGMQPAVRRTGNDDGYPRRNVFRRDMSAAG